MHDDTPGGYHWQTGIAPEERGPSLMPAPQPDTPSLRDVGVVAGIALLLGGVGVFVLLGLPGGIIFETTVRLLHGEAALRRFQFPGMWGVALAITIWWSPAVLVAYLAAFFPPAARLPQAAKVALYVALLLAWAVALAEYWYRHLG